MIAARTAWTLLTLGFLVLASASTLVSAREHKEDPDATEPSRGNRGKGPPSNESAKPREAGKIVQSNVSHYDGRYVDFTFDRSTCRITDYSVYNTTVLALIQLAPPCEGRGKGGSGGEHGASFQVGGEGSHVRIHDAPNGLLRIDAGNETIELTVAAGASITSTEDGQSLALGNLTGLLRLESADEDGNAWTIEDRARFWVHPRSGGSPERVEIRQAIKERKVAGEIDVLLENGSISSEVLTYEEVIVRAKRTSESTFRFLVDGNLTSGRTFVVNLGPGVFAHEHVGLRYWDLDETSQATEVPIRQADGLEDVLEIVAGEGPEYWVTNDQAGKHVLVAVPEFSVHVFEIASLPAEVVPIILWGLIGGLGFVGLGAIGMFRPRRIV